MVGLAEELSSYKFEEIKLGHCKLKIPIGNFIAILEKKVPIRKLAFVSMDLSDTNLNEIISYIKHNGNMVELDLSWNKFTPK